MKTIKKLAKKTLKLAAASLCAVTLLAAVDSVNFNDRVTNKILYRNRAQYVSIQNKLDQIKGFPKYHELKDQYLSLALGSQGDFSRKSQDDLAGYAVSLYSSAPLDFGQITEAVCHAYKASPSSFPGVTASVSDSYSKHPIEEITDVVDDYRLKKPVESKDKIVCMTANLLKKGSPKMISGVYENTRNDPELRYRLFFEDIKDLYDQIKDETIRFYTR